MGAEIKGIDYALPDRAITNEELRSIFPGFDSEKVSRKIGIQKRHVTEVNETALDLAVEASTKVLNKADTDIDFILFCTQSPDYLLPTTACLLQDRLGLKNSIGALDFNLGCSGFVYGLGLAKGLIKGQLAKNILLVTAETYSKHIHPKDKANRGIFGDAASASILSESKTEKIGEFIFGTDGSRYDHLIVKNGGFRNRISEEANEYEYGDGNITSDNHLYMNGPEIFNFTIDIVPDLVESTLKANNVSFDEIDFFILHQANKYMLNYLRKRMKIDEDKYYNNIENVGNTVSSSIPIGYTEALKSGKIKKGDLVLFAGFGVGLSWSSTIVQI